MEESLRSLEKSVERLELNKEERSDVHEQVSAYVNHFWSNLSNLKGYESDSAGKERLFQLEIRDSGSELGLAGLLHVFETSVNRNGIQAASGNHLGYIPAGGLPLAAYGDFLAAATNKYAGIFSAAPGAVSLENLVLEWTAKVFGFDAKEFGGNLTSGGSIGNLMSLVAARDATALKGKDYDSAVVYGSDQMHFCIHKALRFCGLAECVVRSIPSNANYCMNIDRLEAQMAADVKSGLRPFVVVGTVGTTNTGAVDDLTRLSHLAKRFGCWFHVDAAYGGFFYLLDEMKEKLAGISEADSLVVDPHKGLFLPYGSGVVLVKRREDLLRSNSYTASYIHYDDAERRQRNWSPADLSPELTKPFRGLRMWLPLMYHGVGVFKDCLREKVLLARYVHEELERLSFVELGPQPQLTVVLFRFLAKGDLNVANNELLRRMHVDGTVFITSTNLLGSVWLRVAILNFRTHQKHVDTLLEMIQTHYHKFQSEDHALYDPTQN